MKIMDVRQTVFLRRGEDGKLENLIRLCVQAEEQEHCRACAAGKEAASSLKPGENLIELWIDEPKTEAELTVAVCCGEEETAARTTVRPVRHWEVYFLQWSHHDIGYTDLPSHVLDRHCRWYDEALEQLDAMKDMPFETRPRIVTEQFWSLDEYLRRADPEKKEKMYRYIRSGDIEVTALYGNLITEQLGHEECCRALYPAQSLAQKLGVKLDTAAHNDIPGVSWGLCRALCDSGIRYFVPDFPDYYHWGGRDMRSFWDDAQIWDYRGPGAFYWEAQDGKRLMLWSGRHTDGNPVNGTFDWLESCLEEMDGGGYPYDTIRLQGKGGTTDNSPYIASYARSAAKWNEQYAYPRIIIGTNHMFFEAFEAELAGKGLTLPVVRGELPGQDYPLAAMSMAQITSTARETHVRLTAAEKLLALADGDPLLTDACGRVKECYRDLLLADDHAYGYHFPAGPAMRASYWEKGARAMRCEADVHDLLNKAMASIADRIGAPDDEYRLVVFNISGQSGHLPVETPMRPLDNCGTEIRWGNREPDTLKGYILNNRRHTVLETEFMDGRFELIDMTSGESVDYQIDRVTFDKPEAYAAERDGLGHGTRRYGFFEDPCGLLSTLRFVAEDMPPYSYRAYRLKRREKARACMTVESEEMHIQNEIYDVRADEGGVVSIIDRRDGAQLLDADCPYRLGDLLIRYANEKQPEIAGVERIRGWIGPVCEALELELRHDNLPQARVRLALWRKTDRIDVSVRILKDAKPLQTVIAAFPFAGSGIRYQGVLNDMEPVNDFMPGSQSDFLDVQDWAMAKGSGALLSSVHTASMSLGGLHDGYVSPAHRCVAEYGDHAPLTAADYGRGWMFPVLSANNFGTNFMCSQVFDGVYRFGICRAADAGDDRRALLGESMMLGAQTILTDRTRGILPAQAQLLDVGRLQCLTLKRREAGEGYVVRLWNHSDQPQTPQMILNGKRCRLTPLDALERPVCRSTEMAPREAVCFLIGEQ